MPEPAFSANILIIEDDPLLGATLLRILQKTGYRGTVASTGKEAVAAARDSADSGVVVNAALIDVKLPDMNGLDVLREIKTLHPDVGAIIMTGHADLTTALGALNDGAFAYIQKPYNMEDLKAILARAVERQKLIQENRDLLAKLRTANTELEKTVAQRTQELQHANLQLLETIDKLRESDQTKSRFVSMVSHELRTPLTIIIGFSETLLAKMGKVSPEQLRRYVEIIHGDSLRLSRLIEDILNLSRIKDKSIHLKPEKFDLSALAARVLEGMKVVRGDLRFELSFDEQARELVADRDRVEQIFLNLLGNAVKYSPQGSAVGLTVRQEGSDILASVKDSGPGIPESEREKIFDAFYRTRDAINMKSPGTGLGLTITKAILESMGGRIWVESAGDGQGSTFSFSLPKGGSSE